MGDGISASEMTDRHLLPMGEMPADGRVDRARIQREMSLDDGNVAAADPARFHLFGEREARRLSFCDQQEP